MILNSPLTTSHNKTEITEPHLVQLLEDQLDNRLQTQISILRLCEDRQHLLRLLLSYRQEPRAQPCCRDYSLPEHLILFLENQPLSDQFIISQNGESSVTSKNTPIPAFCPCHGCMTKFGLSDLVGFCPV